MVSLTAFQTTFQVRASLPSSGLAVPTTSIDWYGADLVTGELIAPLPGVTGPIKSVLGQYATAALQVPIPRAGPERATNDTWTATIDGRTMVVAVLNDVPIWAGIVKKRKRTTDALMGLGCVTLEGYLDERYVTDHPDLNADESTIMGILVSDTINEGIGLQIDSRPTGTVRDRSYYSYDDKTVYSAMTELMAVRGGPEWTIVLDWTDSTHTYVSKTAVIRDRIGDESTSPNAVFSTKGISQTAYTYDEDYSHGMGANHIVATSSGQGEKRPESEPARDEDLFRAGWPRYEYRFTPSTSIKQISTLNAHAEAELERISRGTQSLDLSARAFVYPRLRIDWTLGDDIGYDLIGHGHPDGLSGVARCIGWELDPQTQIIKPILLQEEVR